MGNGHHGELALGPALEDSRVVEKSIRAEFPIW